MDYNKLSDYDYHLPTELIAQQPLARRDRSRMLVLNRSNSNLEHSIFNQLPNYLKAGDLLVLNNTKVIPARLNGIIAGTKSAAELLLLHKRIDGDWIVMAKPGRKLKPGKILELSHGVQAYVVDYAEQGLRIVRFSPRDSFEKLLPVIGDLPLPPYIKKKVEDPSQYQTIYATEDGSAAAPTAGFHFTGEVFEKLKAKGISWVYITLHIGPGTFQPVKTDDIREHDMHHEYYRIDQDTASILNQAKQNGSRIIAVGSTACRVLETAAGKDDRFQAQEGWTGLYVYPGYQFKAVDAMLTNFHLPRSSLIMLVSALAGYEQIMAAYREAVEKKYRFYSFGDCMLIL